MTNDNTQEIVPSIKAYYDGSVRPLTVRPIRQDRLLCDTGFQKVDRNGDFKADYDPNFIIQVATK